MNRVFQHAVGMTVGILYTVSTPAQTPHEHGAANLNIAVEGDEVLLELISPAVNIVGFEHKPSTAEQQQALDQAVALLRDPSQLFMLTPEADCKTTLVELESSLLHEEEHAEEEHAEEEHAEEEHAEEEHSEEEHSEFHASYQLNCAQAEQLNAIDLVLFARFPGLEEIDVQFIGPSAQFGAEFTPAQTLLEF